jgi:hypothetical protein
MLKSECPNTTASWFEPCSSSINGKTPNDSPPLSSTKLINKALLANFLKARNLLVDARVMGKLDKVKFILYLPSAADASMCKLKQRLKDCKI